MSNYDEELKKFNCGHIYSDEYGNCCKLAAAEAKLKTLEEDKSDTRLRMSFASAGRSGGKNFRIAMAAVQETIRLGKHKLEITIRNYEDTEKLAQIRNILDNSK